MKKYDEMKKEVDAMPDGPEKKAQKKLLRLIMESEKLQKKYEKNKSNFADNPQK